MTSETVSREDCKEIRKSLIKGHPIEDVAEDQGITVDEVRHHLRGDCGHYSDPRAETDRGPRTAPNVTEEECSDMREEYLDDEEASVGTIAEEFDREEHTVGNHLTGRCKHDGGVELRHTGRGRGDRSVSEEDCGRMRAMYVVEGVMDELLRDDSFDYTITTIRRHITGDCRHPGEGVEAHGARIHPYLWEVVWVLYHRHAVPPEQIAEAFGVGPKTVDNIIGTIAQGRAEEEEE